MLEKATTMNHGRSGAGVGGHGWAGGECKASERSQCGRESHSLVVVASCVKRQTQLERAGYTGNERDNEVW